ncbi:MAG: hypothetical protein IPK97_19735 [Ahniella sp.]|nr:hypothetical protein [Ahniella sp.]
MSFHGLMIGASGLVGGLALPRLLDRAQSEGSVLIVPTRRELALEHKALRPIVGEMQEARVDRQVASILRDANARLDVFVSCLGTTIRQAGSQAAFRAVDFELVHAMAEVARRHGARQAILVSSVGADATSRNFYLRTKGELELEMERLGFARCDFLQPGLLIGDRAGPKRFAEQLGQKLLPAVDRLLMGGLSAYRSISAVTVASAVVRLYGRTDPGVFRHVFRDMHA